MRSVLPLLAMLVGLSASVPAQFVAQWSFDGSADGDQLGISVSGVGDVDGDGVPDVAVGAWLADSGGLNSGAVYVRSGVDGSAIWSEDGETAGDAFGRAVAGVADLDADGIRDVLVGAPFYDGAGNNSGRVRVLSGVDGTVIYTFDADAANWHLGFSVADAGDVDGDGTGDLICGARYADNTAGDGFAGRARVYSGATGTVIWTFEGDGVGDQLGYSVSGAGDVDGDGRADLVAGAYQDDNNGSNSGSARVFSGVDGSVIRTLLGDGPDDWFGWSVALLPDVNGDGRDDILVGSPCDDTVVPGVPPALPTTIADTGSARVYSGLDGSELQRVDGNGVSDQLGYTVVRLGDLDSDGVLDFGVGARFGMTALGMTGYARIVGGGTNTLIETLEGAVAGDGFGVGIADAGDLDGDGVPEVIVGSPFHDQDPTILTVGRIEAYSRSVVIPPLSLAAPATVIAGNALTFTISTTPPMPLGTPYIIDVSITGTSPGVPLPAALGGPFPLNPPFFFFAGGNLEPTWFTGFIGALDASGQAMPVFSPPPSAGLIGSTVSAACVTLNSAGTFGIGAVSNSVSTIFQAPTPSVTGIVPAFGPATGSTTVTISGTAFVGGATVAFGGVAASSVVFIDEQTLTAVTPPGAAGAVDVEVTNPGNSSATLTQGFTYEAFDLPLQIAGVTPTAGPVSGGTTMIIDGFAFTAGATVNVGGTAATNVNVISPREISCTIPMGTLGRAEVVVMVASGSSATLMKGFAYIPDLTITAVNPPAAGVGLPVVLTGTGFIPGCTVDFGATSVIPTMVTSLSLSFIVPPGVACAGSLTVSNPGGGVATLGFNPQPVITQAINAAGPVAGGTVFVLLGNDFTNCQVTVGGNPASLVSQNATSILASSPPGTAGSAPIVVTSPSGCTTTATFTYY
ncbi:MAG: hypothetical protein CMJ18_15525 [Phycisphaeraceae bacterium]|nr:hypothetical protein [Phycisphaeraceae bacterium]